MNSVFSLHWDEEANKSPAYHRNTKSIDKDFDHAIQSII